MNWGFAHGLGRLEVNYQGFIDLESSLAAKRDCLEWGLVSLSARAP